MSHDEIELRLVEHYYKSGAYDPREPDYGRAYCDTRSDENISPSAWIVMKFNKPLDKKWAVAENIRVKRLDMKDTAENNFNIIKGSVAIKGRYELVFKPHFKFYRNNHTFDWNKPVWNGLKPGYRYEVSISRRLTGDSWVFRTSDLEFGLYWFKDAQRCAKYIPGRKLGTDYYDPQKPVMLFIHGWERTSVNYQNDKLRDFRIQSFYHFAGEYDKSMKEPVDLVSIWKKDFLNYEHKEWNFGVLYWNQFSDDDFELLKRPTGVEAKIWRADGPRGMRYAVRKWDDRKQKWRKGSHYSDRNAPDRSISDCFISILTSALKNKSSADFRIIGHSMGNQLATAVAYRLKKMHACGELKDPLFPKRLALVDPYWTHKPQEWLNESIPAVDELAGAGAVSTGRLCSLMIDNLIGYADKNSISGRKENFTIEIMSASLLPFHRFTRHIVLGDANISERDLAAVTYIRTEWIHPNEARPAFWGHKHVNAIFSYLWQYAFDPPQTGVSAASENSTVHDQMNIYRNENEKRRFYQISGFENASPEHNEFTELPGSW